MEREADDFAIRIMLKQWRCMFREETPAAAIAAAMANDDFLSGLEARVKYHDEEAERKAQEASRRMEQREEARRAKEERKRNTLVSRLSRGIKGAVESVAHAAANTVEYIHSKVTAEGFIDGMVVGAILTGGVACFAALASAI
jgi:sorbitol-specific phosphotransferase system component IIBC